MYLNKRLVDVIFLNPIERDTISILILRTWKLSSPAQLLYLKSGQ